MHPHDPQIAVGPISVVPRLASLPSRIVEVGVCCEWVLHLHDHMLTSTLCIKGAETLISHGGIISISALIYLSRAMTLSALIDPCPGGSFEACLPASTMSKVSAMAMHLAA